MDTTSIHVLRPNGVSTFSSDAEGVRLPGVKEPQMSVSGSVPPVDPDFSRTQATEPVSTPEDKQAARDSTNSDPEQARLKSRAQRLRARLAQTLQSLTQRKQEAVDLTHQIQEHPLPFAIAGASTLVALIAGVSFLATRRPNMPPTLSERLRAVGDAWMHPHHVARSRARASSPGEMDFTRKAVLTVLSLVAAEGAKIGFAKLAGKLDEKKPV